MNLCPQGLRAPPKRWNTAAKPLRLARPRLWCSQRAVGAGASLGLSPPYCLWFWAGFIWIFKAALVETCSKVWHFVLLCCHWCCTAALGQGNVWMPPAAAEVWHCLGWELTGTSRQLQVLSKAPSSMTLILQQLHRDVVIQDGVTACWCGCLQGLI